MVCARLRDQGFETPPAPGFVPIHHFCIIGWFPAFKNQFGNTGNQNRPALKVRVVLVTCIFNIDFFEAGNQPIMQKW